MITGWLRCQLLDVPPVRCVEVILPRMLPVLALANVGAILSTDWF